ncbi:DUF5685 family protein [Nocardia paucivorans]|uniref:DUF5685 family protein n=1 Tax=Nocardia paucivorans TaxID=114259 RepID=UPI0002E71F2A|nr:DUF5685 family protein [Nocardia paucivorans]
MFGMLRPCAHKAVDHGIDPGLWQSHMCGLCLGLRDGHGQSARIATNTDAIVLAVLTEAQTPEPARRRTAGPCLLRGMRTASVPVSDSAPIQLAATASLLLGSARMRDHIQDGDTPARLHRPLAGVAARWAASARTQAERIGLDIEPLVAAIDAQVETERRVLAATRSDTGTAVISRETALDELTVASRRCAAELFAHTAVLAGQPDNVEPLRAAGDEFGRIAHLVDAIEDHAADTAAGLFNPLTVTDTSTSHAYDLVRVSDERLRTAIDAARIGRISVVRWVLLDPLAGVLHRLGRAIAGSPARSCGVPASVVSHGGPYNPSYPGPYHEPDPHHESRRRSNQRRNAEPLDDFEPPPDGCGCRPLGRLCGYYCTGCACCVDHNRPCSGRRKKAWYKRMDGDCCECCNCCNCCD